jgi:hypothetical protein
MSAEFHDRQYADYFPQGPLRARPAGVRAALGMGAGASAILLVAALLIRVPAAPVATAETDGPTAGAPAKIAAKASMDLENALGSAKAGIDVEAPEFAHEKKVVAAGETKDGSPRVDSVTLGDFGMGGPFLRVDVHPELDAKAANSDFFLDMRRHAQAVGLNAGRIGSRATIATRFGNFEAADIRLTLAGGEGVEGGERACLAARLIDGRAPVEIAGVACGSAAKPIDRVAFACLLDKLSYSVDADNRALAAFFANAEAARGKGCANVSRDDITALIPPQKAAAPARPQARRAPAVARAAPVHPVAPKN